MTNGSPDMNRGRGFKAVGSSLLLFLFLLAGPILLIINLVLHDPFTILDAAALLVGLGLIAAVVLHIKKFRKARSEIGRLLGQPRLIPNHLIETGKSPAQRLRNAVTYLAEKVIYNNRKGEESAKQIEFFQKELQNLQRRIEELSQLDPLTGLPQRPLFEKELDRELRRRARIDDPLTIALIKINNRDQYARNVGPQLADESVATIANIISGEIRSIDLAFSYEPNTFALILPCTDSEGGGIVTRRLCSIIGNYRFPAGEDKSAKLEVIAGSATTSEKDLSSEKLITAAEKSLKNAQKTSAPHPDSL